MKEVPLFNVSLLVFRDNEQIGEYFWILIYITSPLFNEVSLDRKSRPLAKCMIVLFGYSSVLVISEVASVWFIGLRLVGIQFRINDGLFSSFVLKYTKILTDAMDKASIPTINNI